MFDSIKDFHIFGISLKEIALPGLFYIMGLLTSRVRGWWKIIRTRARYGFYQRNKKDGDDVIILDSGVPHFIIDSRSIIDTGEEFRLKFPLEELKKNYKAYVENLNHTEKAQEFHSGEDIIFSGKDMKWLADISGINDLADRIEKARMTVANQFAEAKGGNYFNSRVIGLRKYIFEREGDIEQSKLNIKVYRTDYFTHKVMQDVIHDLLREKIVKIDEIEKKHALLYEKYFPFLAAMGLNVFIFTDNESRINLCRRSNNASSGKVDLSGKLHVTMNEGFTATDYDKRKQGYGSITIDNCYRRGMEEELGITENNTELGEINVYDFFFSKSLFQVGLFAWASYRGSEDDLRVSRAQDRALESAGMLQCDFNNKGMQKLLKEEEFTCYSRTGLENLCRLKNIKLVGEKFSIHYCYYLFKVALGITGR